MSNNIDASELMNQLLKLQKISPNGYAEYNTSKRKSIIIFSPQLVTDILLNTKDISRGIAFLKMKNFFGNGLIVSEDPDHINNKRIMQKDFSKHKVENYIEIIYNEAMQSINNFDNIISLIYESDLYAFNCVAECFLGKKIPEKYIPIYHEISDKSTNLPYIIFTEDDKENFMILKSFIYDLVSKSSKKNNLLNNLLNSEMTKNQVVDEIITILGAGFETTSALITWSLFHLNNNRHIIEKIKKSPPNWIKENRIPSFNEIFSNQDINNIIKETLRINPPAYFTTRTASKDITISNIKIDCGTNIFISQYVCHRNDEYFLNPESWIPDRWDNGLENNLPRGVYFPFGMGSKKCIAEYFAKIVATIFISIFINKKEFSIIDKNIKPKYLVSMIPDGKIETSLSSL